MMLYVTLVSILLLSTIQDSSARPGHHDNSSSAVPSDLLTEQAQTKGHADLDSRGSIESKASVTADASTLVTIGEQPSSGPVRRFARNAPASLLHAPQRNLNYGSGGHNNGYVGSQNGGPSGDNRVSNGIGGGNVRTHV